MDESTRLLVISHTHWDREWYRSFQGFRNRLVFLMDELIREMEANPDYKFFHLDGQTIVLEDYLAIRPESREALTGLIREGRIIVGPWYVMPDEFLVSGESLVRNLQLGRSESRRFGAEPMPVGYVVDIFGHNSQLPQILRGFGIESAVLYRGIGDYPKDQFLWVGADGSRVWTAKLDNQRSYSNFYFALRWPFEGRERDGEELIRRGKELLRFARERALSDTILMMDGVDHQEMEPELPGLLDALNLGIPGATFEHARLTDYFAVQRKAAPPLEEIRGELYRVGREGLNNKLLKNVLSSMVHLKQLNDSCEILLSRWAEPFAAGMSKRNLKGFFEEAWRILISNHPHDSICGCSITRVHQDNIYRFHQVQDIAEGLLETIWGDLVAYPEEPWEPSPGGEYGLLLFNAGQQPWNGILRSTLLLPPQSQGNLRLFDAAGRPVAFQILESRKGRCQGIFPYKRLPRFPSLWECDIAFAAEIPALGYASYRYQDLRSEAPGFGDFSYRRFYPPDRLIGDMRRSPSSWENDYFRLSLNRGELGLVDKRSGWESMPLFFFEDGGDYGDGWLYQKPVADRLIYSQGSPTQIEIVADGPLALILHLSHRLEIPVDSNQEGRSRETHSSVIHTTLTMYRDSSILSFVTELDNQCENHRLRVVFPTGLEADTFYTATPYAMESRPVEREDNSRAVEWDSGVVPSQGITSIGGTKESLGLYTRGLYEVELSTDSSRSIALTLFRSFSREVGRSRGEMGLMKGPLRFEYALDIRAGTEPPEEGFIRGMDWRCGIRSRCFDQPDSSITTLSKSLLELKGPGIVLSSYRRDHAGRLILRVYNIRREKSEGEVHLPYRIDEVKALALDEERDSPEELITGLSRRSFRFSLPPAVVAGFAIVPKEGGGD